MKFKLFFILLIASFLANNAFATLTPFPDSLNCNINGTSLVCQNIPAGMMNAGNSYPPTAGVYTFKNYATLADGILMASYGIENNTNAGLVIGNNRFAKYMVDVDKTVAENSNWQFDSLFNQYECKASAADCGVELIKQ